MKGILNKLILLWKGHITELNKEQLLWVINNQNRLNINTLSVQQGLDGKYLCIVDRVTVNTYRNLNVEESQI